MATHAEEFAASPLRAEWNSEHESAILFARQCDVQLDGLPGFLVSPTEQDGTLVIQRDPQVPARGKRQANAAPERSRVWLSQGPLPLPAERFRGVYDAAFSGLSRLETTSLITNHNTHFLLRRSPGLEGQILLRDLILALLRITPACAVLWGENNMLTPPAQFQKLADNGHPGLAGELRITPKRFRSGRLFQGSNLHGFYANGAESILGIPVAVSQGPLSFETAFTALKVLIFNTESTGALPPDKQTLCEIGGGVVMVQHIAPGPGLPRGRLLLLCSEKPESPAKSPAESPVETHHPTRRSMSAPRSPHHAPKVSQEDALRVAMRG